MRGWPPRYRRAISSRMQLVEPDPRYPPAREPADPSVDDPIAPVELERSSAVTSASVTSGENRLAMLLPNDVNTPAQKLDSSESVGAVPLYSMNRWLIAKSAAAERPYLRMVLTTFGTAGRAGMVRMVVPLNSGCGWTTHRRSFALSLLPQPPHLRNGALVSQ